MKNTGQFERESILWEEAISLASFNGMQPIWDIVLDGNPDTGLIKVEARKWIDSRNKNYDFFKNNLRQNRQISFNEFIENYFESIAASRSDIDDILSIFFIIPQRSAKIKKFLSERFHCNDISAELLKHRNATSDSRLVELIDKFEVPIAMDGSDEWERAFIHTKTLDPFVDLSYPVYRGYLRKSQHRSVRKLVRESQFDLSTMDTLVAEYEAEFGKLPNHQLWRDLTI